MPQTQISWILASTYAAANQLTRQRVIAQILDGRLNGVISDSDWYVLDFAEEDEGDDMGSRNLGLHRRPTHSSCLN